MTFIWRLKTAAKKKNRLNSQNVPKSHHKILQDRGDAEVSAEFSSGFEPKSVFKELLDAVFIDFLRDFDGNDCQPTLPKQSKQ